MSRRSLRKNSITSGNQSDSRETISSAQIPLGRVADVSVASRPSMIRHEDGALTGYVYIDMKTTDYGGFVAAASRLLQQKLQPPPNFGYQWSGEYGSVPPPTPCAWSTDPLAAPGLSAFLSTSLL